jgi:hypothetical protein
MIDVSMRCENWFTGICENKKELVGSEKLF